MNKLTLHELDQITDFDNLSDEAELSKLIHKLNIPQLRAALDFCEDTISKQLEIKAHIQQYLRELEA